MSRRERADTSAPQLPWPNDLAQEALQLSSDLLLVVNSAGIVMHANRAVAQALGCTEIDLAGTSFIHLLDEGSRAKGRRLLEYAARHDGATPRFEINQVARDGSIVMISYAATALPGTARNGTGPDTLLVGRLLTETIATTERLVALNRRLNALFAVAASASRSLVLNDVLHEALGMALMELDLRAGAVFLVDAPAEADQPSLPLAPGQLQLAAQQGFAPPFVARLAQPEQVRAFWNANIRFGRASAISGTAEEIGIAPTDLPAATGPLLSVGATPLRSENQLIGWLYGLTDRYRAWESDERDLLETIGNLLGPPIANARLHDALLQTSGRLQAVLDSIDSGVALTDQEGIVRYANARLGSLLNVAAERWPGQARISVQPPDLLKLERPELPPDADYWTLAGPPRRVLQRFSEAVYDPNGTAIGSIEVFSDITQLEEMNRLKDEFVAAAAHDLKTPVTAIKGYAQIGLRLARRFDEPKLVQNLAMINARSDELRHLMDGLLDMSRIQAGRMTLDLDEFALQTLVTKVVQHFEFDLNRRQRNIQLDVPAEPIMVTWDRVRMESMLINLISNALKYSPDGGPVEVAVQDRPDQCVRLCVTDHGIGIPAEERERIFERFYRVRDTIDNHFKGTGMGLYITQHIVALHGGRIWAEAALHGGPGTTLVVEVPQIVSGSA